MRYIKRLRGALREECTSFFMPNNLIISRKMRIFVVWNTHLEYAFTAAPNWHRCTALP